MANTATTTHQPTTITELSNQQISSLRDAVVIVRDDIAHYHAGEVEPYRVEESYCLIGWHTSKCTFVNRGTRHATLQAATHEALRFTNLSNVYLLAV